MAKYLTSSRKNVHYPSFTLRLAARRWPSTILSLRRCCCMNKENTILSLRYNKTDWWCTPSSIEMCLEHCTGQRASYCIQTAQRVCKRKSWDCQTQRQELDYSHWPDLMLKTSGLQSMSLTSPQYKAIEKRPCVFSSWAGYSLYTHVGSRPSFWLIPLENHRGYNFIG